MQEPQGSGMRADMQNYKMVLAYDGTRYDGWQKQGNTGNTIQGRLEALLTRLDGQPVEVNGSGRTDAGVHAEGQAASFRLQKRWDCEELRREINGYLPKDIVVLSVEPVDPRFHARLNAVSKIYRYRIGVSDVRNVFERPYIYDYGQPLDLAAMRKAAALLCGTHDFQSFCSSKKGRKSTVRTLSEIRIEEMRGEVVLTFYGDGFLYHMVRILTGTLIEVGSGMRTAAEMPAILEASDRKTAGALAPAEGLALMQVFYSQSEMDTLTV